MSKSANVKVYCRIRPENEKEKQSGMKICITPTSENSVKILTESVGIDTGKDSSKNKNENFQTFTFDSVFDSQTEQEKIFEVVAKPLINSALEGINGTLFCYGQTSSGKTYTMEGIHNDEKLMGVIPRMMQYIFILIEKANSDIEYSVKCQYYQIYNEKIQDLLDIRKKDLAIREDKNKGIWVEDCTEAYVSSQEEMYAVFKEGSNNRTVSATNMNKGSSRSHSLFVVTLFQRNTITGSSKTGRIYFVDLAGSEKMSKTGIEGGTGLKEAQNINKSLMTLGMVINSLTEGAKHIPYRDSKLTRVLQESLGGNSMTNLVITCSPNFMNQSETLSTLRFGQRAKLIKNKVVANTQQSVKELMIKLKKAEEKIASLEKIIQGKGGEINIDIKNIKKVEISDKNFKCEECKVIAGQLNYVKNELINTMTENEELAKYKEELCEEIKNKNNEIIKLNDIIQTYEFQLEGYKEENDNYFNEIKNYMDLIMNELKELKTSIKNKDILNIGKIYNSSYKINCDLINLDDLLDNEILDIDKVFCIVFFYIVSHKSKTFIEQAGKITWKDFLALKGYYISFSILFMVNTIVIFYGTQMIINASMFQTLRKLVLVKVYFIDLFFGYKKITIFTSICVFMVTIGSVLAGVDTFSRDYWGIALTMVSNFINVAYNKFTESFKRRTGVPNLKLLVYNSYIAGPILFVLIFMYL